MKTVYLKTLTLCLLVLFGSPFILNTQSKAERLPIQKQGQNLGFSNRTGPAVTQDQVSTFINFINSGSDFYRNDTKAKLQYVSDKMNFKYSDSSQYGYSVIQMGNQTNFDWSIWARKYKYGSVAPGIDLVYPQNSYMFLVDADFQFGTGRIFVGTVGQKGQGIDSSLQADIRNTILAEETTDKCQCSGNPQKIKQNMKESSATYWNAFCSASDSLKGAIYPWKGRYIYIRPKNCYYLLYGQ